MYARKLLAGALAVAILALMAGPAKADPIGGGDIFVLNFDENGNGTVSVNGGPTVTLNGALLPDPTNGGIPALTFLLPEPVGAGDVAIRESAGGAIGDLLRFTNNQTMIFYSLVGGGALADTGFPANANLSFVGATEDANGNFQFLAGGGGNNVYNGISNEGAVPEPTSLAIWSVVALGLGVGYRRRKLAA
jgi:hypothetical protein